MSRPIQSADAQKFLICYDVEASSLQMPKSFWSSVAHTDVTENLGTKLIEIHLALTPQSKDHMM